MRTRILRLLIPSLVACVTLLAQSRDDLKRKYGEPISETFLVRPGIAVTASYAANKSLVELVIAPINKMKTRGRGLSRDEVDAILEELVPVSSRGKFIIGYFIHTICLPADDCRGTESEYEKVTIYYNSADEGRVYYAAVQWKGRIASHLP